MDNEKIDEFILDKFDEIAKNLRSTNKEYNDTSKKFNQVYYKLKDYLTPGLFALVEELLNYQNSLSEFELKALYLTSLKDSNIQLDENFINNNIKKEHN